MSGQDWSIKIVPSGNEAAFVPDLQGAQPGQALQAESSDLISWNNRTGDEHQPWPADSNYEPYPPEEANDPANYLSNPISPWESSTPAFQTPASVTAKTTLYYICRFHPNEHGTIVLNVSEVQ